MKRSLALLLACTAAICASCGGKPPPPKPLPSVAPTSRPAGAMLPLNGPRADAMYRELLPVDLPTVLKVAGSQNLEIRQAKNRVDAAQGRYEAAIGSLFPVISPGVSFDYVNGSVRVIDGPVVPADFTSWTPAALVQWAMNPGRLIYDVVASKKRLAASEHQERHVIQEQTRLAAVQYYELVLAQARLAVARQAVSEAEELVRITTIRVKAGAGLEADARRGEANLARRRQLLAESLNAFYNASVSLAVTLHLDATVTLVPLPQQVEQLMLVREDYGIDELMGLAMAWRADLAGVRSIVEAAAADRHAAIWGDLGPRVNLSYSAGAVSSDTPNANFPLSRQERFSASAAWTFGLSTFGVMKTASASQRQAAIAAEQQLDLVRADVVRAAQAGKTAAELIPMAKQQLTATEEFLRLAQANLRAGTMLTLDVLQAEDAVGEARVRYADAVIRYNQAQVNLLAALGVIQESAVIAAAK